VVYTGHLSNFRATATLAIATGPQNSSTITVNFCDADKFAKYNDSGTTVGLQALTVFLPVEMIPIVLPILQSTPKKFISETFVNNDANKVIGEIGYTV
jgi:hypothetical protein